MDMWGGSAVIKCAQGSDVDKKLRDQKNGTLRELNLKAVIRVCRQH